MFYNIQFLHDKDRPTV